MQIKITQKHKSINSPCEFDLPEFSVLTGKNGSGKTHLLEAIADNTKSQITVNGIVLKKVQYIGFNGLNPNIEEYCDPQTIVQHIKNIWNAYNNTRNSISGNPNYNKLEYLLRNIGDEKSNALIIRTIEMSNKAFDKLTEDDLVEHFDISFMPHNDFFNAQFAMLFKIYHKRYEENSLEEYYQEKGQLPKKEVLNKEEFENKFGIPPWDFVNKILLETNIPYEVNSPVGTRIDSNFIFKLKDRATGFEISSMDLSTGEKVLMSLALAIYNTGSNLGKPDILLLDEPDAGLHPSMSKMMVDVLKKNIVIENKIPTIISTHSPTTIIASDGVSIFQMIRGNGIPKKIPTQEAVEFLSSDIPFLKISNDKRRQVFVESKYDVNYYELLTNIYSRIEKLQSEPIYLAARTSEGSNCSDVMNIVNNLTKNGNDDIYGIIDWDNVNLSKDNLIVLGENDRYSIENYLLDPLLMGLLFLRERNVEFSEFTLTEYSNYSDLSKLTNSQAQLIIDKILNTLELHSSNLISYKIQRGWILNVSREFNLCQGHELELIYKNKYPFLRKYQREDSLKKDIIEKVINDYPDFTPRQLFDTIMKIK